MMAATRSRLECSASESTPKLPVATVRKIFSNTNTSAEPTEASAATCFAELGFELEMTASRANKWPDGSAPAQRDQGAYGCGSALSFGGQPAVNSRAAEASPPACAGLRRAVRVLQ